MRYVAVTCLALVWVVSLVSSSPARADVVGPAPDACPYGGTPQTCHGGPHCALTECQTDADCTAAPQTVCREVSVCVGKVVCAGLLPPDANLADYERPTVESGCVKDGHCPDGKPCETKKLCAAPETATRARKGHDESSGCSVRDPGATRGSRAAIALGITALVLLRRRAAAFT